MFATTLEQIRCPECGGKLALSNAPRDELTDIRTGELRCPSCKSGYPILAGVALLVEDVKGYLVEHVKGIAQVVPDSEIPTDYRKSYLRAKKELADLGTEHIEEDLEAERVSALYLMNHYLSAVEVGPLASPLLAKLVSEHWDQGPLAKIAEWVRAERKTSGACIELGCGVGGLARALRGSVGSYLGVDSSFASIALGRHLALGAQYSRQVRIPGDLLDGPLTRAAKVAPGKPQKGFDLVVGDLARAPAPRGAFDMSLSLNAIDMLEEPEALPELQRDLLRAGGVTIQSCPYIWHELVAAKLREKLPKNVREQGSAAAVEWLYEQAGLKIEKKIDHLPWLFFKHLRQLEIYSVHLFTARKP